VLDFIGIRKGTILDVAIVSFHPGKPTSGRKRFGRKWKEVFSVMCDYT
jgi:hypothetical protein